jgi:phosphoglycerol transferase MdoB-like AlkP superfamily enzyme
MNTSATGAIGTVARLRSPVSLWVALRPVLGMAVLALSWLGLTRFGLALWYGERVQASDGWQPLLLQGLRVDIATLCWLWGPLGLLLLLGHGRQGLPKPLRLLACAWLALGFAVLVVMELATPTFLEEYGVRPNILFVEYLGHWREVSSMLWLGHRTALLGGLLGLLLALAAGYGLSRRMIVAQPGPWWPLRIVLAVLFLGVAFLGARSTLGHRPLNPAMMAFSADPLVNDLVVNSSYSLLFAASQMRGESNAAELYDDLPEAEIIARVQQDSGSPLQAFSDAQRPSSHARLATRTGRPFNLVIVLEESLGAGYVGALGGRPLTPNLDALSQQGWWFERLYATGTRSVRGIEAVVTGFTPTPARSVVKLNRSQRDFFTLASLLRERGYDTSFIYGGESHFDNMRSFFFGNGFERIVDQNDYVAPKFVGSWGVSDEDLFDRAHAEFEQLHAAGKPFFSLVFSSSNHDPFEYPEGSIELYEQPAATRNNAARYADHALGHFFQLARSAKYFEDTVFLVVADHDSRVTGADLVPIGRFHIPGVILAPGLVPRQDARIVSQIDLAPTVLSLMGISATTPLLGRDLTQTPADWPGRAMMQYDRNFALLRGDQAVVLTPGKPAGGYLYDRDSDRLLPAPVTAEHEKDALAWVLWGGLAYRNSWYR